MTLSVKKNSVLGQNLHFKGNLCVQTTRTTNSEFSIVFMKIPYFIVFMKYLFFVFMTSFSFVLKGGNIKNKLASSVDAIAISEI